ncbi:MAG: protein kinase [Planctomycetota bacterium]|nr:protein kinase [Planctomycetota bacterium]
MAVERGYCTPRDIVEAMREKNRLADQGVRKELSDLLLDRGLLTKDQVRAIDRAVRGATVIAGFEILEKVGQGGMGAVFRARQIAMDRLVALKILPPKLAKDRSYKDRFLREARLSAKLNHLNIISGIECGESGGYMYFAMEFVEGQSVQRMLEKRKGALPLDECLKIVRQIAEALQYATRHGLVHRDLKPDNIMVTPQAVAKLCDLGLAKLDRNSRTDDAALTQTGVAVGTPHYISPEQARGESEVDIRSDLYSLGATFYHMLTGQVPFRAESAQNIMIKHLTDEAPSVCELNPEVPEAWGQIVSAMMAKEPNDRYKTPQELIEDLDRAQREEPVEAAKFKGKTSCAPPKRGGRRRAGVATTARIAPAATRRSSSEFLSPVTGDRTRSPSISMRRESGSSGGAVIGGVVVLLGLVALLLMGGGPAGSSGSGSRPRPRTAVAPSPVSAPGPVAAGKTAEAVAPPPGATEAAAEHEDPDAAHMLGLEPAAVEPGEAPPPDSKTEPPAREPKEPVKVEPKPKPAWNQGQIKRALDAFHAASFEEAAKADLTAAAASLGERFKDPKFDPVREELDGELQDIRAAAEYERAALAALAAQKGTLWIGSGEGLNRLFEGKQVKVEKLDADLSIRVMLINEPMGTRVLPHQLDAASVVDGSKLEEPAAGLVEYLLVRGKTKEARERLERVAEAERPRFARRLEVIEPLAQKAAAPPPQTAGVKPQPERPTATTAPSVPLQALPQGFKVAPVCRGQRRGRIRPRDGRRLRRSERRRARRSCFDQRRQQPGDLAQRTARTS